MKDSQKTAVDQLLSTAAPKQFTSFLFDLQNSLIAGGYFAGYTDKGFQEHALYMGGLKDFFEEMEAYSDIKKG